MAFRSNSPMTVALPPFRGVTRQIILLAVIVFFGTLLCGLISRGLEGTIFALFALWADPSLHKLVWQFVTYPFLSTGLFGTLFAAITVWFFGSAVEDELGSSWMTEFFLVCTIGGGVLACVVAALLMHTVPGFGPGNMANSLWPFSLSLLLVFARLHPDQELSFNFLFRVKAKYIAIVYLLIYLAVLLAEQQRFQTAVVLTNALCGWLFVQFAPRRGVGFLSTESFYGMRNAWYRSKRRRAAKKFTVYMQKQGRDVQFDESGRYMEPEAEQRNPKNGSKRRDPNDRSWMN